MSIKMLIFLLLVLPQGLVADAIRIGWSGPLTGNCAVTGVDSLKAVQMAANEVNATGGIGGRFIEIIAEDDQYNVSLSVRAYEKLVKMDKVVAIIANTYGGIFATAQRAMRDGVLLVDALDCNDDIAAAGENVFCLATQTESIADNFVEDLERAGRKKAFVLYEEEPWFAFVVAAMQRAAQKHPQIELKYVGVHPGVTDFSSLLVSAKSSDALFVLGNDPLGGALKQARNLGITVQIYSVGSASSPGFAALAGEALEGVIASSWNAPENSLSQEFLQKFQKQFGRRPYLDLATLPSYDAANVLFAALERAQKSSGAVDIKSLRREIYSTRKFEGVTGTISVDSDGAVRSIKEQLFEVRNGKLVSRH